MPVMRARRFAAAVLVLGPVLLLAEQTQKPVFRSGVELVDVAVVVTDRDGRFVPGLTTADFRISERGVSQTITAFDRVSIPVWRADAAAPAPTVPADVATNERPGDGRLFVLVLDALHVAPGNIAGLRLHARRFIEQYVGPSDLVAVLSPGAIDEATEDFTSDKARLIAAITRFSGTKLRSATLELEAERQAAAVTGVVMHGERTRATASAPTVCRRSLRYSRRLRATSGALNAGGRRCCCSAKGSTTTSWT